MKHLAFLSIILGLVLVAGCGEKSKTQREIPKGVVSKDSLAFYLSQLHMIDAAMRHKEVRKQSLQTYAKRGFIDYFDTASITKERFKESMDFWSSDYEAMAEIYDLSMARLSTKLANIASSEVVDENEETTVTQPAK